MTLGPIEDAVAQRLAALEEARVAERIWAKDPLVWSDDPATPELVDRLGSCSPNGCAPSSTR